ncbi:MAG: DNA alkylation repair protein [Bacteroidales bacterium]|nr:DNA alkylation repair protein [Bacteroidales bacterium]
MTPLSTSLREAMAKQTSPEKIRIFSRFFKTGPGQYGEGDQFWGLSVPTVRALVKPHTQPSLDDITDLLADPVHEVRLAGGLLLVNGYQKAKGAAKEPFYNCYMANTTRFNNWDLVDLTCYNVVGDWLYNNDRAPLFALADSDNLWEQRIAMVSTMYFIRKGDYSTTLALADKLLHHTHDLMHKAVGWMLREVGKRDIDVEKAFLLEGDRYRTMPRTTLRYAIERFPEPERLRFLKGMASF